MPLEPIQHVALLIAASTLVFLLAISFRPGSGGNQSRAVWSRFAREGGLAVLAGGFVALVSLAAIPLLQRFDLLANSAPDARPDNFAVACIVLTLFLLCSERGRWTGNQPATILAALIPWLLVPELNQSSGVRLPTEQIGLVAAAVYRVVLSGARSARQTASARRAAIDATGDGMLIVDLDGVLIDANAKGRDAFRELGVREKDKKIGEPIGRARLPERARKLLSLPEAQHFSLRNASDRVYEIWLGSADRRDLASTNRALIVRDVSVQRRDEQHLLKLAHCDSLTGLANRRLFIRQLERALDDAHGRSARVALLYIDLDRFKEINDTLGHGAGDELLRVIAGRFEKHVFATYPARLQGPKAASVARLGGDEFAVIVPEPEDKKAIERLAGGLLQAIRDPVALNDREIASSGSIGIALYPEDGRDVETLVKHADSALYGAKRMGRNRYQRYQPEFSREADRTRAIEQELREAITRDEFNLYYQPKIDVRTDTVGGFEALLRWKNRELGVVGPDEFIPIAEERGLIAEIGAWCLEEACKQQRAWQQAGFEPVPVAVNVSSAQFIGTNLQDLVKKALRTNDLPPELLEIELTERLLLEDNEATSRCLSELSEMGVQVALDDFGTGYSALTYLNRFPLSVVKMDRGLLVDIETSDSAAGIAAAVISMCHSLDLKVVAEGVDSEGQLTMLREMSCDQIQGFLYAPALRPDDVVRFLAKPGHQPPVLKPKPSATVPVVAVRSVLDATSETDEWQTDGVAPNSSRPRAPRVLLMDDTGSLASTSERLRRLGVEVFDVTTRALGGCFDPPDREGFDIVVAPSDGDLSIASEVLDAASNPEKDIVSTLIVVGDEPDESRREEIRASGARWVLWAPFDDSELRFLVRSCMPQSDTTTNRFDSRVPMDAMAWIRFRSRRDVGVLSSLSRRGGFIEMAEPLPEGVSCKVEFEFAIGRVSTFAKVAYQQIEGGESGGIFASGIGVTFYGLDPATEFTIGELVEAQAAKYKP